MPITREVEMGHNFTKNILPSSLDVASYYIKIPPTLSKNNCILSQETCFQVTSKFFVHKERENNYSITQAPFSPPGNKKPQNIVLFPADGEYPAKSSHSLFKASPRKL